MTTEYMAPYLYVEFKVGDAFQIEMNTEDAVHSAIGAYAGDPDVTDCGLLYMEAGQTTFIDAKHAPSALQPKGVFVMDIESASFVDYSLRDVDLETFVLSTCVTPPKPTSVERALTFFDDLLSYLQTPTSWPVLLRRITTFLLPVYFLLLATTAVATTLLSKIVEAPDWFRLTFVSWDFWWNGGDHYA